MALECAADVGHIVFAMAPSVAVPAAAAPAGQPGSGVPIQPDSGIRTQSGNASPTDRRIRRTRSADVVVGAVAPEMAVPAAAGATAAHVESRKANCQPERRCGSSSGDRCGSSSESSCERAIAPAGSEAAARAWSQRFVTEWDEDQEAARVAEVDRNVQTVMEEAYDKHMAT